MRTVESLEFILSEALEYFEAREDVIDGDYGKPEANREMQLATMLRDYMRTERTAVAPERIRALIALSKHARHAYNCDLVEGGPLGCDCGYDAALATLEATP